MGTYQIDLEKERQEILKRYRKLMTLLRNKTTPEQKRQIRKAFNLAVSGHKDMRRKTGEPYIYHPIEVARIVAADIGLGATSVICALLHDLVEDTEYTLQDMEDLFGPKVAKIIDGLTKIEGVMDLQTPSMQAENFKKILLTLSDDIRVMLIKLADRLHNMRTLDSMIREKQLKIASETSFLYAPLAHRLGLYAIKSELEDLAMKYIEPEIYHNISGLISKSKDERERFIQDFTQPIKKILKNDDIEFEIVSRIKSVYSIWQKMKTKGVPFEQVYDLFAIRIIIDTPTEKEKAECWKAYTIVTSLYRPNPDRLRDWISIPKANGYESLHTTVMSHTGKWVEIQIRSRRMNEIAEKGYAAHWKYKHDNKNDQNYEAGLDEWLSKIREILKNKDNNALDFVSDIKLNLFSEEIFVFTPKGEMKSLPKGSTILDFAYNIHSDLGNSCIGGKVNYNLVPMSHVLQSGEQVEIITSKIQKPKPEWLNNVVTSRAREKIKDALRADRKIQVEEGKVRFVKILSETHYSYSEELAIQTARKMGFRSINDFLYRLNNDEISISELKKTIENKHDKRSFMDYIMLRPLIKRSSNKSIDEVLTSQLKNNPESLVLDEDIDQIKYNISKCCNPIHGDQVVGFITDKNNIQIHRTNCEVAIGMMSQYGNRIVKAKWRSQEGVSILTGLTISGLDKKGLVKEIIDVVSGQLSLNMRSINFESSEGVFEGIVMVYVQNLNSLNDLISKLKEIKGIDKVNRINSYKGQ
jgi:guanosine-3',5'-bis(diphosphate) 3'-pyrophosphohydrolase